MVVVVEVKVAVGPLFAVVAEVLLNPFEKSDTLGVVVVVVVVVVAVNENGFSVDDELDKDMVSEFVIVDRGCCCVAVAVVVELVCTGSGLKPLKPLNPANIDGFSESSFELDNDDVVVVVDEIGNGFKLANGELFVIEDVIVEAAPPEASFRFGTSFLRCFIDSNCSLLGASSIIKSSSSSSSSSSFIARGSLCSNSVLRLPIF